MHYGDALAEHAALRDSAGVLDLSFRSRLCLTGADRKRFLHGQVSNEVNNLNAGEGCYAALVTAKGKLQSDLNIYCLESEVLLDFEPGLSQTVSERFEKYVIADDVQVVDVSSHYGLVSIQGPKASDVIASLNMFPAIPAQPHSFVTVKHEAGDLYCVNHARGSTTGFDLFVPISALETVFCQVKSAGARPCGWDALEMIRIEAGIPRFGADMDATNLASEAGIEARAISYAKGCYIGQEIISRIRAYGQVAKALRGLKLSAKAEPGDKLSVDGKEVGYITSALASPTFKANIALGYVRREHNEIGAMLEFGAGTATVVPLPFSPADLK